MPYFRIALFFFFGLSALNLFAQEEEYRLLQDINQQANDTVRVNKLLKLVDFKFENDLEQAEGIIQEISDLSRKLNYRNGLDQYLNLKGKYHFYREEFDSAVHWYKKYIQSHQVRINIEKEINTLSNIGISYSSKNQLDSAYFYLNKSLGTAKRNNRESLICNIFNNLGLVLAKQDKLESSIEYFELAYDCSLKNKKEIPSEIIINLATLYTYTQSGNKGIEIEKLVKKSEKALNRNHLLTLYINLGSTYNHTGHPVLARKYLTKADSINRIYQTGSSAHILHALAHTELLEGNKEKALSLMNKVESSYADYSEKALLLKDLAKLNFELKNFGKSRHYYESLIVLKDSVFHTEIQNTVLTARKDIEFYKKESEIKDLELEKKLSQSKRHKERILALLLGIFLMMGILLIWVYYKKEKTKRKLNEILLENKNKKLLGFYDKIAQRNQVISEIEKAFSDYKSSQSLQKGLKQDIIDTLEIRGDWEVYNHYFEDQHKGFYQSLKAICPELTNNELRLCSLTKLRMSIKETADVLNLSVDAVKSGRYRLKKKLNVGADENLSDFLNNIND